MGMIWRNYTFMEEDKLLCLFKAIIGTRYEYADDVPNP